MLHGHPRSFGLSLVQGYFVEPLLSLAAPRSGHVLLPGAALEDNGGALLVMGASRSGKSTLMARALACGRRVLGDDQVLVDPSGRCCSFPRRMRVYPDLAETAPAAYARLGRRARAALIARRLAGWSSRGFIGPPLGLDPSELGGTHRPGPLAIRRVVVIGEYDVTDLRAQGLDADQAVGEALTLLDAQRALLGSSPHPDATALVRSARDLDRELLGRAFEGVAAERLLVPYAWDAARAVDLLARRLQIA